MTTYEFDHVGRASRSARSPHFGLADAQKRMSEHTYRCITCLRRCAGYSDHRCGVGQQIDGQIKVFEKAIERNDEG